MEVKELTEVREAGPPVQGEEPQADAAGGVVEWRSRPSGTVRIGMVAALVSLVCAVASLAYALRHPVAIDSFVAMVAGLAGLSLALFLGLVSYGYRSLRYGIADGVLTIRWLWVREIIPLGRIEGLYGGHRLGKKVKVDGLPWPGHHVGRTRAEGLGRLRFYGSSSDPSAAIIIATTSGGYAITPTDLQGFKGQLIELLESIPLEELERAPEPRTAMPRPMQLSILRDGVAIACTMAAVLLLLVSFGYVSAKFPELPELMPLHFNFAGEPDLIGPPRDAFRMPGIGLLILLANGVLAALVHSWQRAAGRVLVAATLFVQLVMLMAVLRVVH
ncbi:MAG: PH domain-containing protein [Chloroflexota bacterium]